MKHFISALTAIGTTLVLAAAPGFAQTAAPSPQATAASSPAPAASPANNGKHLGQIKKLRSGTLTEIQVRYALTHTAEETAKLRKMHTVRFENLRVFRAPAGLLKKYHASTATVAYDPVRLSDALAQTSGMGSFLNIFANINVQDALNNALNGNTVNVSLSDVLNGNNIAIGQVVGVYVNSGGVITTIIYQALYTSSDWII